MRLAHEADLMVVAPATANLVAKLALGLADDLLSSTLLEYEGQTVSCPRCTWGCGRTRPRWPTPRPWSLVGSGWSARRPAPWRTVMKASGAWPSPAIVDEAVAALEGRWQARGRVVVVTAGPTHEPIDPVRFIGNPSTGGMGTAIAREAAHRGADVRLVLGPGTVSTRGSRDRPRVVTAEEMRAAVLSISPRGRRVVMAAAVADFRPKRAAGEQDKEVDAASPTWPWSPPPTSFVSSGSRVGPGSSWSGSPRRPGYRGGTPRAKLDRRAWTRSWPTRWAGRVRGSRPTRTTRRSSTPPETTSRCATGARTISPGRSSTGSRPGSGRGRRPDGRQSRALDSPT